MKYKFLDESELNRFEKNILVARMIRGHEHVLLKRQALNKSLSNEQLKKETKL